MNVSTILESFAGRNVLVIGDVILDRFISGTSTRNCPEADAPVIDQNDDEVFRLGGAGNVAADVAALGAKSTTLIGVCGDDFEGDWIDGLMGEAEIRNAVQRDDCRITLSKTRILCDGTLLARVDRGDVETIGAESEGIVIGSLYALWHSADVVIVSDYGKGTMTEAVITDLGELQRSEPKVLVINAKRDQERYRSLYANAFVANAEEKRAIDRSPYALDTGLLVETRGPDGCIGTRHGKRPIEVPGIAVDPAYPSGAGDTFTGALTLSLASRADDLTALTIANRAASIVVTDRYTSVASRQGIANVNECGCGRDHAAHTTTGRPIEAKPRKPKTVLATGCFDVLHPGHIHLLESARKLGDRLIVGINTDWSVGYWKPGRPVNTLDVRMEMLRELKCVDDVVSFNEVSPEYLIEKVCPDVYVKGGDYSRETLPEWELAELYGAEVVIIPLLEGHSTTASIEQAESTKRLDTLAILWPTCFFRWPYCGLL